MKNITWSDTLSIGVEEVDDDHRRLADLFNLFVQAVIDEEQPDYVEALLAELISFTTWHFRHEERLMLRYDYPAFDDHKEDHRYLLEAVGELQEKFLAADKQVTEEDIEYLERWLIEHIMVSDMPMGSHLASAM